jgi:hypothetical protein
MCTRRPNWFATPFSTISSACERVMTRTRPRRLVLYTAREQSFFVDSIVLLLFRAKAPFRRLLLLWTGVRAHTKNCKVPRKVVGHRIAVLSVRSASRDTGNPSRELRNVSARPAHGLPGPWSKANRGTDDCFLPDGGG